MNATFRRLCMAAVLIVCFGLLAAGRADQDATSSGDASQPVAPPKAVQPGGDIPAADTPAVKPTEPAAEKAPPAAPAKPGDEKAVPTMPPPFAAKPTFQDDFGPDWEKQQKDWRVATWKQNGTEMLPERCATDGKGHLVQTVLAGEPYRGGSMQTAKEYPYGRWVARVKPSAVPGVLNSIFTNDWDDLTTVDNDKDGTKFEVDIEFLSYTFGPGRGKVHLAIHGGTELGKFVDDPDLGFNPSDDYHVWGFDILPDRVVWHVDGRELRTWKCPEGKKIPVGGHEFFFNSWTSPKWIKGPPKEKATYYIDWVRFYPLTTK